MVRGRQSKSMPDKREIEALIERAIKAGSEVTIVTIGGRTSQATDETEPQPAAAEMPASRPGQVVDPVIVLDPESGLIVEANPAFQAWSGAPAGAVPALASIDPEGQLKILMRRAVESRQTVSLRPPERVAVGVVTVEAIAVPVSGSGRTLVQLILREGPSVASNETEIRRALRRLAEILNALPSPLLTLEADGRIRSANPAAEDLLGRGPAAVGLNIEALAAPISAQVLRELIAAAHTEAPP